MKNRNNLLQTCNNETNITKYFIRYKFVSNKPRIFFKFYFMTKYNELELQLLNVQIGCMLRLGRLKKNLSQHDLALLLGYTSTMIGRVERFENVSSWDKIFSISKQLNIIFCNLFVLQNQEKLLSIVNESYKLEKKLTQEKEDYYSFLKKIIVTKYNLLENEK